MSTKNCTECKRTIGFGNYIVKRSNEQSKELFEFECEECHQDKIFGKIGYVYRSVVSSLRIPIYSDQTEYDNGNEKMIIDLEKLKEISSDKEIFHVTLDRHSVFESIDPEDDYPFYLDVNGKKIKNDGIIKLVKISN